MNPVLSVLIRLALLPFTLAVVLLPRSWEVRLGKLLGRLFLKIDPKRRKIAQDNIRRCLPALSSAEQKKLLRENYEHYGILALEILHMFTPFPGHYRRYCRKNAVVDNYEVFERLHAQGKGVIAVTGHFANWEIAGSVGLQGIDIMVTGKRIKPEWLNTLLVNARLSINARTASGKRILPEILRWISKEKNCAVFILDQYTAPPAGVPAEFFGVTVDTQGVVGLVANRTGAPIFMAYSRRDAKGVIHGIFEEVVLTEEELKDPVQATQALTRRIERWLRENPAQWLWVHRRFKNVVWPAEREASRP